MKTTVVVVDGVLRKHIGASPIPEGLRLYQSLAVSGQVILVADGHDKAHVDDWLELQGCVRHVFVVMTKGDARVTVVNVMRRQGYDIDLVVVPDPAEAAELIGAGFNTLLFTHAAYAIPDWRPDAEPGVRAWDDITHQTAMLARMKAADARIRQDDA